jgi:hypothetical protein
MKKKLFALAALVVALGSTASPARAQNILSGDVRTACEVILCLSAPGARPEECTPPLKKFFSIKKPWKRVNFLRLCPKKSNNDWDENKLVYNNLTDPNQTTEVLIGKARPPQYGGELIAGVEDVRVYTCTQLKAMPQFAASFPPPADVPNGYMYETPWAGWGVFYAVDGYANKALSYAGVEVGIGAAIQKRFRTYVVSTGADVEVGPWGPIDASPGLSSCGITDPGKFKPAPTN